MKSIWYSTAQVVLLTATLLACSKAHTGGGGPRSLGDVIVNGTGFDNNVHEITKVLYTLKDIHEKQNYTLRTEIGLLPGGQAPDGTLTVNIYSSVDAYTLDSAATVTSAVALQAPNANIYEVNFKAPSSGDYVVVISGASLSIPGIQFFYNLRLMSADPTVPTVLTPFATATIPASDAQLVNPLNPGYLNIYNGGDVDRSGTFTISLTSSATTTIANPQIFVYKDSTLTINSLIASSIPSATNFIITRFNAGVPDTSSVEQLDTDVISGVTFTSRTDSTDPIGGPFIVVKGFIGAATYTLSVGP